MNDSELDRLLDLAHGYIEESLSPNELAELERWLGEDAEARRRYLAFLHDHATLYWDRVGERQEAPPESELDWEPRVRRFPNLWQALAAAAVVALLALVLATPQPRDASFATMHKTEAAHWESGPLPTAEGARLGQGQLDLIQGLATIRFDSGAEVTLEAPARLVLIDPMHCRLERGTVVAEIGPSAEGFTVETPRARVIDHGTRFAVHVDPQDGATQTQVFDGLVEVEQPETKKRVALREGQSSRVAGSSLGGVSESPEEGTWSQPEAPPAPKELGLITLTTATPGGADAYADSGRRTNHVSDTLLLLKRGIGENPPHRKVWLRFPLEEIPPGAILSARLDLRFTPTGWGLASHLEDSEFILYGLLDDAQDDWDASSLHWERAPANEGGSGHGVQLDKVRELGRFQLPRGVQSGRFGIEGEALARFLNEDRNRRATLLIVRETPETRSGGLVHAIASSRHPTLPPPSLHLKLAVD